MDTRQFHCALCVLLAISPFAAAGERTERFDKDPGWEGINNRASEPKPRTVKQDFGYSPTTANAGGEKGEIGGLITAPAEPAFYAKKNETKTFNDTFSASGRLRCNGRQFHPLIALFNADTGNECRTPNCIAL